MIQGQLGTLNGYIVFINDRTTGETVMRSWKERLFSWPWKPWKATKFNPFGGDKLVPDGEVMVMEQQHALIMNSKTQADLIATMEIQRI